ncbi:AraC family transcriptional regulator [Mobilitalea sibirica]|uniref:AraC family transcriptional regulator n=2 Tax=Mobilitalea sibirica TaxID=1462919 RepID=A0A8J7HCI0_9FIRM|nr:AraC family transcriptional regulator [Mobilitalea sibirica]
MNLCANSLATNEEVKNMAFDYDLTYNDFNPTVFYVSKIKMTNDGVYHDHDFTELAYILSGKGKYLIEGKEYDVEAGDLVICNPGVKHTHIVTNTKEPTIEFIAGFTDFHFKNMAANSIELKNGGCIIHTSAELKQELSMHCYSMIAEKEGCKVGKYFMFKTHLMQMLLLVMREMVDNENPEQKGCNFESYNKSYAVNRIITYLNENFDQKISLEQIAHNMYLSPVYISKIFKEETGESPINYLIKIRLDKAREILLSGESGSIKSIATQVGYDDVYHFSKLFKKYYGISPLYYKKRAMRKNASNQ